MSTQSKPLSYGSAKCVLQYLSLDTRARISSRCRSLRTADRVTPLKLDYLRYKTTYVTVNDVKYSIGMIIEPTNGDMSDAWIARNQSGGFRIEVDENGRMLEEEAPEAPGDLHLNTGDGVRMDDEMVGVEDDDPLEAFFYVEQDAGWTDKEIYDEQEDTRYLPYPDVEESEQLKYKSHAMLTVTSPRGTYSNRCPDGMRLHEALKKVTDFLFKGRRLIHVKKLSFFPNLTHSFGTTIRLPEGFGIRIEELELLQNGRQSFEVLKSIMYPTSFPLKAVKITGACPTNSSYHHPMVLDAEQVTLNWLDYDGVDDWTVTLLRYKNAYSYTCLHPTQQVNFLRKWAETRPSIGRIMAFGFNQPKFLIAILENMKSRLQAKIGFFKNEEMRCHEYPLCLIYPIDDTSEIIVSIGKGPNHEEELAKEHGKLWALKMEVVPIGSAADEKKVDVNVYVEPLQLTINWNISE